MLSKLDHPNVIKYVGFTTAPHCLIIQEFAANGDLRTFLENAKGGAGGELGPEHKMTMALDIGRGMEYLHGRTPSVIHRDLKTPNLLVDHDQRIKITDFGLAREKVSNVFSVCCLDLDLRIVSVPLTRVWVTGCAGGEDRADDRVRHTVVDCAGDPSRPDIQRGRRRILFQSLPVGALGDVCALQ